MGMRDNCDVVGAGGCERQIHTTTVLVVVSVGDNLDCGAGAGGQERQRNEDYGLVAGRCGRPLHL